MEIALNLKHGTHQNLKIIAILNQFPIFVICRICTDIICNLMILIHVSLTVNGIVMKKIQEGE